MLSRFSTSRSSTTASTRFSFRRPRLTSASPLCSAHARHRERRCVRPHELRTGAQQRLARRVERLPLAPAERPLRLLIAAQVGKDQVIARPVRGVVEAQAQLDGGVLALEAPRHERAQRLRGALLRAEELEVALCLERGRERGVGVRHEADPQRRVLLARPR